MSTLHRSGKNKTKPSPKGLHPRNLHRQGYDFTALSKSYPPIASYVKTNAHGNLSIEFADPLAVTSLNAAILKHHYDIIGWNIPEGALCPPIPGRADYIHNIAELLGCGELTKKQANDPSKIALLDIGTGANGIYPLDASPALTRSIFCSPIPQDIVRSGYAFLKCNDLVDFPRSASKTTTLGLAAMASRASPYPSRVAPILLMRSPPIH